jgi:hypothetical protein
MLYRSLILAVSLSASSAFAAEEDVDNVKYGPAAQPFATLLSKDNAYVRKAAAPDYWVLQGYYEGMRGDCGASAASVATVLNALRRDLKLTKSDSLITEKQLLIDVTIENWANRLTKCDDETEPKGVSLDQLGTIVRAALELPKHGIAGQYEVEVLHVADTSPESVAKVRAILEENEKSADDFLIANYRQKDFTNDYDGGDFSTVGAFDATSGKERVLIMEVDRQWYEPYWVSLTQFVTALATQDKTAGMNRGLLWVKKKKSTQ